MERSHLTLNLFTIQSMRLRSLLVVVLVFVVASPALAYVPEKTPHRDAEAAARTAIGQRGARGTTRRRRWAF